MLHCHICAEVHWLTLEDYGFCLITRVTNSNIVDRLLDYRFVSELSAVIIELPAAAHGSLFERQNNHFFALVGLTVGYLECQ